MQFLKFVTLPGEMTGYLYLIMITTHKLYMMAKSLNVT